MRGACDEGLLRTGQGEMQGTGAQWHEIKDFRPLVGMEGV